MFHWPEGKSLVFAPIVAWEIWPDDLGSSRSHQAGARPLQGALYDWDMGTIYEHDYGEVEGLPRLLDIFDAYNVKVTFIINGLRVERDPALAREIQRRGHDLASENYLHEYTVMYTVEQERDSLTKTVEAFQKVLGVSPSGYISPGHRPTPNTIPNLFQLGYKWNADFMNRDSPFLIHHGDQAMVGMPYGYLTDYPTYLSGGRTPRQMLEMLWDEFRRLRREALAGKPRMMTYGIHAYLSHGLRTVIVEEFLEGLRDYPDVWVATCKEAADWVRGNPGDLPQRTLEEVLRAFPKE